MPGAVIDTDALFAPLLGRRGIGLAVSGGGDSLALMLLVARWVEGRNDAPAIYVYAVDHGLRPEAADEAAEVVVLAARYGLAGRALRWEGDKPETGVQAAARAARYRLIGAEMQRDGADLLLTAHHMEDQAETVLMRLAHGSGVEGLRGMAAFSAVEGCAVYRPLLNVPRAELRALVAEEGLVPAEDPSNADLDYERVRWRQLLPTLSEMGLDPMRLSTFARRMGELDAMVDAEVVRLRGLATRPIADGIAIEQAALAAAAPPVALRLLGRVMAEIGDKRRAHALAPVEALLARVRAEGALKRTSLYGCLVSSDGVSVHVAPEPGRSVIRKERPVAAQSAGR